MNKCKGCGVEIPDGRIACGRKCSGRGPREKKYQPKKPIMNKEGYYYYNWSMLTQEEKDKYFNRERYPTVLIHRLEMAKFLGRPLNNGEVVMHVDGDKSNNSIDNLIISNHYNNSRQHFDAIIAEAQSKNLAAWVLLALS